MPGGRVIRSDLGRHFRKRQPLGFGHVNDHFPSRITERFHAERLRGLPAFFVRLAGAEVVGETPRRLAVGADGRCRHGRDRAGFRNGNQRTTCRIEVKLDADFRRRLREVLFAARADEQILGIHPFRLGGRLGDGERRGEEQ